LFFESSNSKNTLSGFTTLFFSYHPGCELLFKTLFYYRDTTPITPNDEIMYVSAVAPSANNVPADL
jgi:hypothetical protein